MKKFQPRLFKPLMSGAQSVFPLGDFSISASPPIRSWDGVFKIPEGILKFLPGPKAPPKQEDEKRQAGEKRNGRRMRIQVEVLAYPLRPKASDIPLRGDLKNLCPNGVCVEFLRVIDENRLFLLDFKLTEETTVRRPARVVWSRNRLSGFELLNAFEAREVLKETKFA